MNLHILIVATVVSCSAVQAAAPSHWTIVSQERRVWARVSAGFGVDVSDNSEEFYGDYGHFDQNAIIHADLVNSVGFGIVESHGSAFHNSRITTRQIFVNLGANGSSYVEGNDAFSETFGWARMSVEFDLDTNGAIRLDGEVECPSTACFFQLSGPEEFTDIDIFLGGMSHYFDGGLDVYAAPAGHYTLYADTYANTVTVDEFVSEIGHIDVEVSLVSCGDPIDPVECVLADGNRGDLNADGAVDVGDMPGFTSCLTGPMGGISSGACLPADVDEDGDVDLADFSALIAL